MFICRDLQQSNTLETLHEFKRRLLDRSSLQALAVDESALHHNNIVCTSRECVLIAGFLASNLNEKVNPCDDFYEYACGNYAMNRHLPANKPIRHTLSDMQNRLNKQIKKLLEAPVKESEKPWQQLGKHYYQKCIREDELESHGVTSIRRLIRAIGGWPVLDGRKWRQWTHGWEKQLASMINKTGVNAVILEIAVTHDPQNSSRNIIEIDQPKWGIGSRWPYLSGIQDPIVQNYTSMMVQTAINIGADPATAEHDMRKIIEFELKLVNYSADDKTRRDPYRGNNRCQLWQLREHFPNIKLDEYINAVFNDLVELSPNDTVIVREPDYFLGIQEVMKYSSKRVVANYIIWRVVQAYSLFLPPSMRDPFYLFKANQSGMSNVHTPNRWEDCVFLASMMIDMPVGRLYVESHFERTKAMQKMADLTKHFKEELIKQLRAVDWMDEMTRARAIIKAEQINYKSGFPEYIFNETFMDKSWTLTPLPLSESLLDLTVRIKLSRVTDELLRLKKNVDSTIWFQSPAQVDAYYAPNLNEMIFPAGIMQFPLMSLGVPNYITYAMLGAVIGHEVSHAFDDQGGRYDEYGNLHDWWDAETAQKFHERTECFIKQYSDVKVEDIGVHLNGRLSVGENIADNAGIKTAFMAYKSWLDDEQQPEAALPGFQNFSSAQMFFIAYANNWCSLIRPMHYVQIIMADVHAPNKYRAIIPLQNRPEFSEAFECPLRSAMNPVKKCSIW